VGYTDGSQPSTVVTTELWIVLAVVVAAAAFVIGRLSNSRRTEIAALTEEVSKLNGELETTRQLAEADRVAAQTKAAEVEAELSDHFEQSAALFGKLAHDYRDFLEHFAESAQKLGLSEARSRELIEQVTSPLIAHEPDAATERAEAEPAAPKAGSPETREPGVPTLDPISAKVAEIELEESKLREPKEAPRRAS
jgi:uncharacterized membrane-anchored protein YhcB (DUF1043 family)